MNGLVNGLASERQRSFLRDLAARKQATHIDILRRRIEEPGLTARDASEWITRLVALPDSEEWRAAHTYRHYQHGRRRFASSADGAASRYDASRLGVYRKDGEIIVVVPSKTQVTLSDGSTRPRSMYSKRLVPSASRLNGNGEPVDFDLVYEPAWLGKIAEGDRMPLADARAYMIRYGRCLYCRRTLVASESVERGIGPVCAKRFA